MQITKHTAGHRAGMACAVLLLFCVTAGCGPKQMEYLPADQVGGEIAFFDSFSFDRQLSSALRADLPEVPVVFPATITINSIPPRLEKWFSMVEEYGGKVTLVPETEGKGIVSEVMSLFIKAAEYIKEKAIYGPVEDYDAALHFKQGSGIVTKVLFVRKTQQGETS